MATRRERQVQRALTLRLLALRERQIQQVLTLRLLALSLAGLEGDASEAIPDAVWNALHEDGLLASSQDQTGEYTTYTTGEGHAALLAGIRELAEGWE